MWSPLKQVAALYGLRWEVELLYLLEKFQLSDPAIVQLFGRVAKRSRVCLWYSQLRNHSSLLFLVDRWSSSSRIDW
jgi:hypothetical protein